LICSNTSDKLVASPLVVLAKILLLVALERLIVALISSRVLPPYQQLAASHILAILGMYVVVDVAIMLLPPSYPLLRTFFLRPRDGRLRPHL
jgi:hypothetical protein